MGARDPRDDRRTARRARARAGDASAVVAGVRLTHPDRVMYPEQGVSKRALARYYEAVAAVMLVHVRDRPLALVRCPRGRDRACFYQKHPGAGMAEGVARVEIEESDGPAPYLWIREARDLVALVQAGVLELHAWGSTVDDLERPDRLVFDLDPAPGVAWSETLQVARDLRARLRDLGLESFPRLTGGKGVHLVVPLQRSAAWPAAGAFARAVADAHASDAPRRVTADMAKAAREGKVFVDYLRNARGATAIASYATRARPGAPVAVPVRWDELTAGVRPDRYHVGNVRRRLAALRGDPWDGFEAARRPLTPDLLAGVGAAGETADAAGASGSARAR